MYQNATVYQETDFFQNIPQAYPKTMKGSKETSRSESLGGQELCLAKPGSKL